MVLDLGDPAVGSVSSHGRTKGPLIDSTSIPLIKIWGDELQRREIVPFR
jgi:hypothetical protein